MNEKQTCPSTRKNGEREKEKLLKGRDSKSKIKDDLIKQISEGEKSRFYSKIKKGTGCWNWTGCLVAGYGVFKMRGKMFKASRVSFILKNGGIIPGNFVCHHCDNPKCVNPNHLFQGSAKDNSDDRDRKNRQASGKRNGSHTMPHRRATGDRSGSRLHPESLRRGDDHWTRRMPDRVARGCRHGWARNPEKIMRGSDNPTSKLNDSDIPKIRMMSAIGRTNIEIASIYNINNATVSKIVKRQSWKHIP